VNERPNPDLLDVSTIVASQKVLNRRLLWLFTLPFFITAVLVVMFFTLNKRLTEVEVGTQVAAIERILLIDQNYAWAVDQYNHIAQARSSAPILARLGTLYFLLDPNDPKNQEIALAKLEAAKDADPNYWEIYRSLTFIYLKIGQYAQAIEAGEKALKLNRNDANTYNNLAWIYATSPDPTFIDLRRAQEYGEKAVGLTKEKQANFLDTLAQVYFNQGDRDRAVECLRKAKAAILDRVQKVEAHFKKLFPNETL
jgi:tetratricopeptide (TPR) repeat protein